MRPFILWTGHRTAGSMLYWALARFGHGILDAPGEPFDPSPKPDDSRPWASIVTAPIEEQHIALRSILRDGYSIRHVFDHLPLAFNVELAMLARELSYRQIHLDRINAGARLLSLHVAETLDAWLPMQAARRYAEVRAGTREMPPIDAERRSYLLWRQRRLDGQWRRIAATLGDVRHVATEDFVADPLATVRSLLAYLGDDPDRVLPSPLNAAMSRSDQNTRELYCLVRGVAELGEAVAW
jgi:hypothetical protein